MQRHHQQDSFHHNNSIQYSEDRNRNRSFQQQDTECDIRNDEPEQSSFNSTIYDKMYQINSRGPSASKEKIDRLKRVIGERSMKPLGFQDPQRIVTPLKQGNGSNSEAGNMSNMSTPIKYSNTDSRRYQSSALKQNSHIKERSGWNPSIRASDSRKNRESASPLMRRFGGLSYVQNPPSQQYQQHAPQNQQPQPQQQHQQSLYSSYHSQGQRGSSLSVYSRKNTQPFQNNNQQPPQQQQQQLQKLGVLNHQLHSYNPDSNAELSYLKHQIFKLQQQLKTQQLNKTNTLNQLEENKRMKNFIDHLTNDNQRQQKEIQRLKQRYTQVVTGQSSPQQSSQQQQEMDKSKEIFEQQKSEIEFLKSQLELKNYANNLSPNSKMGENQPPKEKMMELTITNQALENKNRDLLLAIKSLNDEKLIYLNQHDKKMQEMKNTNTSIAQRLGNFIKSQKIIVAEKDQLYLKYKKAEKREQDLLNMIEESENSLLNKLEETNIQIKTLIKEKQELTESQTEIQKEISEKESSYIEQIDLQKSEKYKLESDMTRFKEEIEMIKDENKLQMGDLLTRLENSASEIESLRKKLRNFEEDNEILSIDLSSKQQIISRLQDEAQELRTLKEQLSDQEIDFKNMKTSYQNEVSDYQKQLQSMEIRVQKYGDLYEETSLQNEKMSTIKHSYIDQIENQALKIETLHRRLVVCMLEIERMSKSGIFQSRELIFDDRHEEESTLQNSRPEINKQNQPFSYFLEQSQFQLTFGFLIMKTLRDRYFEKEGKLQRAKEAEKMRNRVMMRIEARRDTSRDTTCVVLDQYFQELGDTLGSMKETTNRQTEILSRICDHLSLGVSLGYNSAQFAAFTKSCCFFYQRTSSGSRVLYDVSRLLDSLFEIWMVHTFSRKIDLQIIKESNLLELIEEIFQKDEIFSAKSFENMILTLSNIYVDSPQLKKHINSNNMIEQLLEYFFRSKIGYDDFLLLSLSWVLKSMIQTPKQLANKGIYQDLSMLILGTLCIDDNHESKANLTALCSTLVEDLWQMREIGKIMDIFTIISKDIFKIVPGCIGFNVSKIAFLNILMTKYTLHEELVMIIETEISEKGLKFLKYSSELNKTVPEFGELLVNLMQVESFQLFDDKTKECKILNCFVEWWFQTKFRTDVGSILLERITSHMETKDVKTNKKLIQQLQSLNFFNCVADHISYINISMNLYRSMVKIVKVAIEVNTVNFEPIVPLRGLEPLITQLIHRGQSQKSLPIEEISQLVISEDGLYKVNNQVINNQLYQQ